MTEIAKKSLSMWADESHRGVVELRFKIDRTLFTGESEFQRIDIVESAGFGRMLFNDGVVMLSERDEHVYHEMIAHVPLFVHPRVERVLVIGGGDGGTVREVLRHPSVRHCRLVEIDPVVVEACKAHIPQTAAALDDPRVEVSIADGVEFVAATAERFDLVIVDSTDPVGPGEALFGEAFYVNVRRVLNDGGVVVSQAESPHYEPARQRSMMEILDRTFERAQIYNYSNLTYPGGLWSFTYATADRRCPVRDFVEARVARSGLEFKYYNAGVHRAAFALPEFQAVNLRGLASSPGTES